MWNDFFPTNDLKTYLTLHKEEGKWTNDLLTKATALYLGKVLSAVVMTPIVLQYLYSGRNIVIVGTSNIGKEVPFGVITGGDKADTRHPLFLGYIQNSHYLR